MNILIFGATSTIAQAVAMRYAAAENRFYLVARNGEKLAALHRRLIDSGAGEVETAHSDLARLEDHPALIEAAFEWLQSVDLVLIAHGTLPDQARCEQDAEAMLEALNVPGLPAVSLLPPLAPGLLYLGPGPPAANTAAAGPRGRPSNYVYGSAKALVSAFLQGLRGKLHGAGVHVIDIRPGLVDSPMTAHLQKSPLFSSPERVAGGIVRAVARKKHTVYVPGYWYFIMEIVRFLPDAIFKRLNF
ncbi:MAG: SDR family NAD(P)-dependent oxidoreductase [Gammaproteobacteria bacterium]|nr:SDR family NAD(P)-dependent oxidoreductase [Gammaproteobacteria bacterium]